MSDLSAIRIGPLNLRDIVWLVTLLSAVVGGYFAFEKRLTLNEERIRGYSAQAEKNSATMEKFDHFTTAYQEIGKMNERRISQLEANFNIMSPRLERIDTNLQWLTQRPATPPKP